MKIGKYEFSEADVAPFLHLGLTEADLDLLCSMSDPMAAPSPEFIVDAYGIRTKAANMWPEVQAMAGLKLGHPVPGNWHWPAVEWVGVMKSVRDAGKKYRVMEWGAGWGPGIVSSAVLARLKGIQDIRMVGVEGDPHHFRFMQQHVADNGFDPATQAKLFNAAVAAKAGTAYWPVTSDSSGQNDYGFRPIEGKFGGDYMDRKFQTQPVKLLAASDLVRMEDRWDLIHIDIQGGEFAACNAAIKDIDKRVARLCIGTHSRKQDGDLFQLFSDHGWLLEHECPAKFSFWPNPPSLEAMTTHDGVQIWKNLGL